MLHMRKLSVSVVPLLVVITAVIFFAAAAASGGLVPSAGADAADAGISGVRGIPHPGLYQLMAESGSNSSVRGMPHPGLYTLMAEGGSISTVRGVPHPGLYRLPAADAPLAIGSDIAGCYSNTTARALGVDGGLMGLLFDRSAQTAYAASSVSECRMASGASGS